MKEADKRIGKKPVPDDVVAYMNAEQLLTYRGMQSFGWYLKFVRRPLFQRHLFVMAHPDSKEMAVLEEDGTFNRNHDIPIRSDEIRTAPKPSFSPA